MPCKSRWLWVSSFIELSKRCWWSKSDRIRSNMMVQSSLDFIGLYKILKSGRYVVGRLYFGVADCLEVNFSRKLNFKPNIKNFGANWKTFAKRYRVNRVTIGSQHNFQHKHTKKEIIWVIFPRSIWVSLELIKTFTDI